MSSTHGPRRIGRSIGAVFTGFVAVVVLSLGTDVALHAAGVFPQLGQPMSDPLLLLATVYRSIYSIAGSYIAARLAPDQPMTHALALGLAGLVISTVGAVVTWSRGPAFGPHWYPLALIVLAMPCAWIGGVLHRSRQAERGGTQPLKITPPSDYEDDSVPGRSFLRLSLAGCSD